MFQFAILLTNLSQKNIVREIQGTSINENLNQRGIRNSSDGDTFNLSILLPIDP